MRYKLEYKYGRLYAFYCKHWWSSWKPLTSSTLHLSLYPNYGDKTQLSFKNHKEAFNNMRLSPDRHPKMVIYCR